MNRPVYVLGAGFSKTISQDMPVTSELTNLLRENHPDISFDHENLTFEQWFTINSTTLPFLETHENTFRKSNAEKILNSIGNIIENQTNIASQQKIPDWLENIIRVWHFQKAIVITLNYDTLIERAVNSIYLSEIGSNNSKNRLYSENITHPSPRSISQLTNYDQGELFDDESFQLIKIHGSTNWFYSDFDHGGIFSSKLQVREMFEGKSTIKFSQNNLREIAETQNRLIIPPVVSKDRFYETSISNSLWKTARKYLRDARDVTFIGYSLPPEDFVTGELIKEIPSSAKILIADRFADQNYQNGITKNIKNLGFTNISNIFNGDSYIQDLLESITPIPKLTTEDKAIAIPLGDSSHLSILAIKTETNEPILIAYNKFNRFNDHGMPITEELINLHPELNLSFNYIDYLKANNNTIKIGNIKYKIIHLEEKGRFALAHIVTCT
ncbi:SIR2 family protein [Rothia nasisuis]|uniref:SIR2 family protein n=1 Tax=Rothia nasisuis TaxID=2109647 RepID=UPI001F21ECFC|nr:SIR2 family protein [Rothia nasisuis]